MITIKPEPYPADCLIAGRRAAYAHLEVAVSLLPSATWNGVAVEDYDGRACLNINGFDVGPVIDAAVLETVARLGHPDQAATVKRRRWWQLWR